MKRLSWRLLAPALSFSPVGRAVEPASIVCNLGAFTKAERARHLELIAMLKKNVAELRELPDGYAFRYSASLLQPIAEWALLESKCCPFLDFQLELEPQPGGPAWLRLRGSDDVKEFTRTEFEPLIALARAKGRPQ